MPLTESSADYINRAAMAWWGCRSADEMIVWITNVAGQIVLHETCSHGRLGVINAAAAVVEDRCGDENTTDAVERYYRRHVRPLSRKLQQLGRDHFVSALEG